MTIKQEIIEDWQWASTESIHLFSHPIAYNKGKVAILSSVYNNGYPHYFIKLFSKNLVYSYEFGRNNRNCRTIWELECQKSRLINEGFNIDWIVYQTILNMYVDHFKIYAPYIP